MEVGGRPGTIQLAALTGDCGSGLARPRWLILQGGAGGGVFSGSGY